MYRHYYALINIMIVHVNYFHIYINNIIVISQWIICSLIKKSRWLRNMAVIKTHSHQEKNSLFIFVIQCLRTFMEISPIMFETTTWKVAKTLTRKHLAVPLGHTRIFTTNFIQKHQFCKVSQRLLPKMCQWRLLSSKSCDYFMC